MSQDLGVPCAPDALLNRLEKCQQELVAAREERDACLARLDAVRALGRVGTFEYRVPESVTCISDELCHILGLGSHGGWFALDRILERIHVEDRERHARELATLAPGATTEFEHRIVHDDGQVRWVWGRARVEGDGTGQPLCLRGVVQDVTDFVQARFQAEELRLDLELQLRQAQKMDALGQLAGGVAHDFNNLLVVIQGYTDLLLQHELTHASHHSHLRQIGRAADRASQLTQRLLTFSRKEPARLENLSLKAVLQEMEPMLRRLLPASIDLRVSTDEGPELVEADRIQMEQVLLNLCINARDAMPEGGTLTLRLRQGRMSRRSLQRPSELEAGDFVILEVSDTGQGIPPESQCHVFEPFFTSKGVGAGTGLGLATVYGIVQHHHGTIDFDSVVDEGTTFRVCLPAAAAAAAHEPVAGSTARALPSERRGGHETILLAEDDALVRDVTTWILTDAGYEVVIARDGAEACLCSEGPISVAILDMVMPRMGGRDVADLLRSQDSTLPVIFCTGYGEDFTDCLDPPPNTWLLAKPFTGERLLRLVREALDSR